MNKTLISALAVAAGVACAHAGEELPRRDAGLWDMTTSLVEMGGVGMRMQTCIDDSIEDLMVQDDDDADCTEQSYRKEGARIVFEATCTVDGSNAKINGVFTGDFARHYEGEIRTAYTPPLEGMTSTTMKIEARWVGACTAGQQPGDVVMKGMTGMGNVNLEELMQRMQESQKR